MMNATTAYASTTMLWPMTNSLFALRGLQLQKTREGLSSNYLAEYTDSNAALTVNGWTTSPNTALERLQVMTT